MSQVKTFLQNLPDFTAMVEAAAKPEPASEGPGPEFQACVEAAYVVASADGNMSEEEMSTVARRIEELTAGKITMAVTGVWLAGASAKAKEMGRDGLVSDIARRLDSETKREAGFMVAANASWKGGGIGAQEGLALQAISRAFGWEMSHMHKQLARARS